MNLKRLCILIYFLPLWFLFEALPHSIEFLLYEYFELPNNILRHSLSILNLDQEKTGGLSILNLEQENWWFYQYWIWIRDYVNGIRSAFLTPAQWRNIISNQYIIEMIVIQGP